MWLVGNKLCQKLNKYNFGPQYFSREANSTIEIDAPFIRSNGLIVFFLQIGFGLNPTNVKPHLLRITSSDNSQSFSIRTIHAHFPTIYCSKPKNHPNKLHYPNCVHPLLGGSTPSYASAGIENRASTRSE